MKPNDAKVRNDALQDYSELWRLIPRTLQTPDQVVVHVADEYILVKCKKLSAIVLEVMCVACRRLLLDFKKQLDKT